MINLLQPYTRWRTAVIALLTMLSVSGCSGITPDGTMTNDREEGPEQGLFTGPGGEFVIGVPASSGTEDKAETEGTAPAKSQE